MRNFFYVIPLLFASVAIPLTGCNKDDVKTLKTIAGVVSSNLSLSSDTTYWHQKHYWKADDYFDDPKVIALCKAIDARDLKEIDRLVAEGADINTKGKGNMTPLLWAFSEDNQAVFKRLLEYGADPNVKVTSDFDTKGIHPGDSVLCYAAEIIYPNLGIYFTPPQKQPSVSIFPPMILRYGTGSTWTACWRSR